MDTCTNWLLLLQFLQKVSVDIKGEGRVLTADDLNLGDEDLLKDDWTVQYLCYRYIVWGMYFVSLDCSMFSEFHTYLYVAKLFSHKIYSN